jgi:hypothetical protein
MASTPERQSVGFITVRLHPEHGYFGGLLLVNQLARPLEFHCTLPIKPSRAQSILYGTTLDDFICGEQIARALAMKAKSPPFAFFTDTPAVLSLRNIASQPIALVESDSESDSVVDASSLNYRPNGVARSYHRFKIAGCSLASLESCSEDSESIRAFWQECDPQIDLSEPFGRIADALLEAHPTAKAA